MWQQYTYRNAAHDYPYFVYTPAHHQVGTAMPLVVMLHGCMQTPKGFAAGTGMNDLADQYGFVVMYPQQLSASNRHRCWNWFNSVNQRRGSGEPARIVAMVQAIQQDTAHWTIDPHRIYVAGISAGGAMAGILGATYPHVFAAIAIHSGVEYQAATTVINALRVMRRGGPNPVRQGQAAYAAMGSVARVVPTIVFHGTHDHTASVINGDQVVQQWMQTNSLASNQTYVPDFSSPARTCSTAVLAGHSYTVSRWSTADDDEVQAYWKVEGMGHAWSGGNHGASYTDAKGPNASLVIYEFFMKHPLDGVEKPKGDFRYHLWKRLAKLFL